MQTPESLGFAADDKREARTKGETSQKRLGESRLLRLMVRVIGLSRVGGGRLGL
jgi:hypothetical protein